MFFFCKCFFIIYENRKLIVVITVAILSQFHLLHATTLYFLNVNVNHIMPSMARSPKWRLRHRFSV